MKKRKKSSNDMTSLAVRWSWAWYWGSVGGSGNHGLFHHLFVVFIYSNPQKILPICEFNGGPQWNLKIKRAQLLTIEKWDNLAIFKLVAVKQEIQIEPLQAAKAAARELWNVITQFFIRLFAWPDFFFFALQQNISQSSSSDFFSPKYL